MNTLRISKRDNVAVALHPLAAGAIEQNVVVQEPIQFGHKFALHTIKAGDPIIKYGYVIGIATQDIAEGCWVHVHNVRTNLSEEGEYEYTPAFHPSDKREPQLFQGYLREDGRAATRNEIWILPIVGCVNSVAQKLTRDNQDLVTDSIDGLYTFSHPFGCSQLGEDAAQTKKLLAALVNHPNAGAVLVLALGCETLPLDEFQAELKEWNPRRVKFMVCQKEANEFEQGRKLLQELAQYARGFKRQPLPVSKLVIGLKCGGSDGLSGITANPAVGQFSDLLISQGGSTILTEVPEMFGAETMLMERCINREIFDKTVSLINDFKHYYTNHGQVVYENPSNGNKEGGITTLEDKSCGCVQKGGTAPVMDVLAYGDQVSAQGLNLLSGPGNDLVSSTALTAAGAHIILFTTGRGTPFGAPVPTVKISTNSELFEYKSGWIDFNAGTIADGEPLEDAGQRLLNYVLEVASGRQTLTEKNGYREISIFKDGVVL